MGKEIRFVLAAAALLVTAPTTNAAQIACGTATVMGQPQQVCWLVDTPGSGTGGGGPGNGGDPGSGGDGGSPPPSAVPMLSIPGSESKVSSNGKLLWTPDVGCADDTALRSRNATLAVAFQPNMPIGTNVIVRYTTTGEREMFKRVNNTSSIQFAPIGDCL